MILNILIVDDHQLFRQGLTSIMRTRQDLVNIVGEAATGAQAVEKAALLRPDVILMDIQMPDMCGLEAAAHIRRNMPSTAIVILTASETDEDLCQAIQLGAAGYLLKNLDANELFDLLKGIQSGEPAITPVIAARLMRLMGSQFRFERSKTPCAPTLTEREYEVLHCVVKGLSNPRIAEELLISVNTVKVHLRNILEKLRVENRAQAAVCAVQQGLVDEDSTHRHLTRSG